MSGRRGYSRADVTTYHPGYGWGERLPAVNIKRHLWESGETGDFPTALLEGVARGRGYDPDPFAAWWRSQGDDAIENLIDGADGYGFRYFALESELEYLAEWCNSAERSDALFPDHAVTLETEGRSGGWLVVRGLPDLDTWDAVMLSRWRRFERIVRHMVDDFAATVAGLVCINTYESELAEAEAERRRLAEVDRQVSAWATLCGTAA